MAERQSEPAALIDDAYKLRNDLFHVRGGVDASSLPRRSQELGDRLEPLIAPGLFELLGRAADATHLPAEAVGAHPVQLVFSASMESDPSRWDVDNHPFVEVSRSFRSDRRRGQSALRRK